MVQKIITLRFDRGLTIIEIAEVLNRGGKRTRTGKRWTYYSVRSVLSKMHIHDEKAYHMGRHMEPTLVVKLPAKEKKDD
ncbi:MAG TPA: recombinase family protein [Flavobacteriales bacterium]|nr:recombinase family protein [Flavobacteriales bacterium]